MNKSNFLLLLLALCCCSAVFAQGKIQGQIQSSTGQPLDAVVVQLRAAADSSLVKSELSDANGQFLFEPVKWGSYRLSVAAIGFVPSIGAPFELAENQPVVQLPPVQLEGGTVQLNTVTISAKVPLVERKIDRTVVNVDAMVANAGTTALEVLEKSPGVMVDANGSIKLRGKQGVTVFIDDKPTYLSEADLANYLRSLPASAVDKVELMTNPPARYDAAGNAGVIVIRLKKNVVKGFSGGFSLSYGQGFYHRSNNSLNFNYRVNKINVFGTAAYSDNNNYQDLTIWRNYFTETGAPTSAFVQRSFIKKGMKGHNAKLGVDYYLDKKSTFGLVLSGFYNPARITTTNNATVSDAQEVPVSLIEAVTPVDQRWRNGTANLNYSCKLDSAGRTVSVNLDQIYYASQMDQTLTNRVFAPDKTFLGQTILDSDLPTTIQIRTAKVDYTHPLPQNANLEGGVKSSWINTDNTARFFDVVDNVPTPNYEFSNRFLYKENINAAYLNYNKSIGKWSIQSGLRFENTQILGNQLGNPLVPDSTFERRYNSLFPTFYANYTVDSAGNHQLGLSFGRRIERPDYQNLNPFTYPMDRFTIYGGNPFLQPTFAHNVELSHTFKNQITTTLSYSYTKDVISETIEQGSNIFYSRPGNFGKSISYGVSVNAQLQPVKWCTVQLYTEVTNNRFESLIYGQVLDTSGFYWAVGPVCQFQLGKTVNLEVSGNYQTRIPYGQFSLIPVGQVRAGIAKKILDNKGTIKLNVNDIFYTQQPGGAIHSLSNSTASWLSYLDTRVVTLSFSYRYSRGETLRARQSGGSEAEQRRVRT